MALVLKTLASGLALARRIIEVFLAYNVGRPPTISCSSLLQHTTHYNHLQTHTRYPLILAQRIRCLFSPRNFHASGRIARFSAPPTPPRPFSRLRCLACSRLCAPLQSWLTKVLRMCPRASAAPPRHGDKDNDSPANTRPGQIESNYDETTDSFDAMNLKAELLRGVYAYGFERPSAIQQRAIMPVIKGAFTSPFQPHCTPDG